MHRQFASAALLQLSLMAAAPAQTTSHQAPPTGKPATDCPMHDQAGGHMMQPGATPMHHGQPMPEAMEHCRTIHHPAATERRQQMMRHPGEPTHSQKQEKDQ
ncbi:MULTISPECIES: hypothetical protein [Sphingobium]|uniref:hypothetical protein n=1 Tax=Sphingobium sp. MI1205 TaxID=407020 RepID=UPI0007706809|nr:hypothetical protein [Sphingobium sp. MI1205]AMK17383.1 hypothetical protein K663_04990 [Sphingobium sp. MI1205]